MKRVDKTEMSVLVGSYLLGAIHCVLEIAISPQTCT